MSKYRAYVEAVQAEIAQYLKELPASELPMPLDNWAAIAGCSYYELAGGMRSCCNDLLQDYYNRRKAWQASMDAEVAALPTYEAKYLRPIAEKYDRPIGRVRAVAVRLGVPAPTTRKPVDLDRVKAVAQPGMRLAALAEAAGATVEGLLSANLRGTLAMVVRLRRETDAGSRFRYVVDSVVGQNNIPRTKATATKKKQ